jgi:hypothetical protein
MSIVLVGSTSGSITLQEPAVAGSTVLTLPAVTGTVLTTTSPKAGNVIQVVSTTKTDVFTASAGSWVAITGLSVSITPLSTSSKILIISSVSFGTRAASDYDVAFALYKNSSVITGATGNADGNRTRGSFSGASRADYELNNGGMNYLDSPASTSAQTYAIYGRYNGGTMYINRCFFDDNDAGTERGISTITVMEIAA